MHDFFDRMGLPVADVQTGMKDAVDAAFRLAKKGETVLLSPCCASFDLFNSYEDRGDQYQDCFRFHALQSIPAGIYVGGFRVVDKLYTAYCGYFFKAVFYAFEVGQSTANIFFLYSGKIGRDACGERIV